MMNGARLFLVFLSCILQEGILKAAEINENNVVDETSKRGVANKINGVLSVVTLGLSAANQATGGCMYYPKICDYKDECKELHSEVMSQKPDIELKNETLTGLNTYNSLLWTTLSAADNKNIQLASLFKEIQQYAVDIADMVTGIDLMSSTLSVLQSTGAAANLGTQLEASLISRETQGAATFMNVEVPFINAAIANTMKTSVKPATSSSISSSTSTGTSSTSKVGSFFKSSKWSKFTSSAGAVMSGALLGITLYMDITSAKQKRDELKSGRDSLRDARDGMLALRPQLETAISQQESSKVQLLSDFDKVSDSFQQLCTIGKAYSDAFHEIASLPSVTVTSHPQMTPGMCDGITKDNIIARGESLQQFVNEVHEELASSMGVLANDRAIQTRIRAVQKMKDLLESWNYCIHESVARPLLIQVGQGFDSTLTDDDVVAFVRKYRPDLLDATCVEPTGAKKRDHDDIDARQTMADEIDNEVRELTELQVERAMEEILIEKLQDMHDM